MFTSENTFPLSELKVKSPKSRTAKYITFWLLTVLPDHVKHKELLKYVFSIGKTNFPPRKANCLPRKHIFLSEKQIFLPENLTFELSRGDNFTQSKLNTWFLFMRLGRFGHQELGDVDGKVSSHERSEVE